MGLLRRVQRALKDKDGKFEASGSFADALTEGLLNKLVRVQLIKGPRDKDEPNYGLRLNAFPLVLNGLSARGMENQKEQAPRVLYGVTSPASCHDRAERA